MFIDFPEKDLFTNVYREKKAVVFRGIVDGSSFSVEDLDELLYSTEVKAPYVGVHDGTKTLSEDEYSAYRSNHGFRRRSFVKSKLYDLLGQGSTLILNSVEGNSLPIQQLCLEVSRLVGNKTIANGYLSIGNKQSFGKHWDTHDVFAVQLIGKKHWQVFTPTFDLPLPRQTSREYKADCPSKAVIDIELTAGDILYIPRGWWHCATGLNEATFHIAIGVHPPLIKDYINWVCNNFMADIVDFRKALHFDGTEFEQIEGSIATLINIIQEKENLDAYKLSLQNEEKMHLPFDVCRELIFSMGYGVKGGRENVFIMPGTYSDIDNNIYSELKIENDEQEIHRMVVERGKISEGEIFSLLGEGEKTHQALKNLSVSGLIHFFEKNT